MQPRTERVSVGGTEVETLIGGQGAPLLVLHGAGGPRGWRRWQAALSERFTVYAPTSPGYGQSDSADWMDGMSDLARFYLWYLDVFGLTKVHLLGTSMGGWTAAELVTMNPQVVDRLVLVSAVGLKPEQGEIFDIFYYTPEQIRENTFYDPAQVPEWDELYGQPPTPEAQDIALRNREMTARLTWKPYMHNPRLQHFLPRVTNPTLVVGGREDRIVPPICAEQYARLLPNATLRLFEHCGHSPQLERPDELVRVVSEFLSGSGPLGTGGR